MFPDKDLGCNSRTISRNRMRQQNIAVALLSDLVGTCKLNTLSSTKVVDNMTIAGMQEKYKEFVRFLIHRPSTAGCASHLVGGAIVNSLAFHPAAKVSTPIAGEFPSVKLRIARFLQDGFRDNASLFAIAFRQLRSSL